MLKNKLSKILIIACLFSFTVFSQENKIRIGVKKKVASSLEKNLTSENFIDAFEYEVLELLEQYSSRRNIDIELVEVRQDKKFEQLKLGQEIDALLFTFSESDKRRNIDKIVFSIPYYQNTGKGLITNNKDIDVNSWKNEVVKVGIISSTNIAQELNLIKLSEYGNNVKINEFESYQQLIKALKEQQIDAAAGDVSRLLYEVNEGNLFFGGHLPTKNSKIGDNYCIGITPKKSELKVFFDDFIVENESKIRSLEKKWVGTAYRDAYGSYYNKEKNYINELKNYLVYLSIGAILLFGIALWVFSRMISKRNQNIEALKSRLQQEEKKLILSEVNDMFAGLKVKLDEALNNNQIAKAGIDFFNTAESSITYVGSGGFLSDKILGEEWKEALENCLKNPDISFERVVDLPEMELQDTGMWFVETDNFSPYKLESQYIGRFQKWLFIQYSNLKLYKDSLAMYNSRGAALWSYGLVIMIKDEKEVLIFTTNKNEKSGTVLLDKRLANTISRVIKDIRDIGKENVTANEIKDLYFKQDNKTIKIINAIDGEDGVITPEIMRRIDDYCEETIRQCTERKDKLLSNTK